MADGENSHSRMRGAMAGLTVGGTGPRPGRGRGRRPRESLSPGQTSDAGADLASDSSELSCEEESSSSPANTSSSLPTSTPASSGEEEAGAGRGGAWGQVMAGGRGRRFGRGRGGVASSRAGGELSLSSSDSDLSTEESSEAPRSPGLDPFINVDKVELLPPQQRIASGLFPGKMGRPCKVQTNHFSMKVNVPNGTIYM